jgi:alkylated DNA nucleotide flippase Atl1
MRNEGLNEQPREVAFMAVNAIPDGWWTGYSDLRELVDHGSFQTVGSWMNRDDAPRKAYRVLQSTGNVSPGFVWNRANADRAQHGQMPQHVLEGEGVRFDARGRADQTQRLNAHQLERLIQILTSR